jgi:superfamily II DNA or RNA helicase
MNLFEQPQAIEDRAYQHDAVERLRVEVGKGIRRLILQASTGAGKTIMACLVISSAVAKGSRVLFLAHARELIYQCSNKLATSGIEHGIIMRGDGYNLDRPVQVASKDTLISRAIRNGKLGLPPAELVVVDECHLSMAKCYLELLNRYPKAVILGLTATPARKSGKGLGDYYKTLVCAIPSSELIRLGYLVRTICYAPYRPDLKGVHTRNGDYAEEEVGRRMDKPQLIGDIVEHWKRLGNDRQTIVRATGIRHSQNIRDAFLQAGIKAEHVDGNTPAEERDQLLRAFAKGDIRVLTNCNVINVGFDCPAASCLIDADPTKSYVKFRQGAGRIQRPYPEKADALYLDHAGNIHRHGLPDADVEWSLKETEHAYRPKEQTGPRLIECPQCRLVSQATAVCPGCGYRFEKPISQGREIKQRDGQLVEINSAVQAEQHQSYVAAWHRALAVAANRGRSFSAAGMMLKEQTGVFPWDVRPALPNMPAKNKGAWAALVADVYPQYVRRRSNARM